MNIFGYSKPQVLPAVEVLGSMVWLQKQLYSQTKGQVRLAFYVSYSIYCTEVGQSKHWHFEKGASDLKILKI